MCEMRHISVPVADKELISGPCPWVVWCLPWWGGCREVLERIPRRNQVMMFIPGDLSSATPGSRERMLSKGRT